MPVLTPEYALGLPIFARRFVQDLCARLPRGCVLVLNNYQEVPSSSVLHQLLPHATPELPVHVSVIVMSRQDPPTTMAPVQAGRAMIHVGPAPLQLSKAEATAIIHLQLRRRADRAMKSSADEVYRRVGGWAAGLMLMLEHLTHKNVTGSKQVGATPDAVFHFLATEVMERLAPDVQEVLLKTSVLSDISVPLAEQLTNRFTAGEILSSCTRRAIVPSAARGRNLPIGTIRSFGIFYCIGRNRSWVPLRFECSYGRLQSCS